MNTRWAIGSAFIHAFAAVLLSSLSAAGADKSPPFQWAPAPTEEETAWQRVAKEPTPAAITEFLRRFPSGRHHLEAERTLNGLKMLQSTGPPTMTTPMSQPVAKDSGGLGAPTPRQADRESSANCRSISERSQLGEPMSDADRAFFTKNCH